MGRQITVILLAIFIFLSPSWAKDEATPKRQTNAEAFIELGIKFYDKMQYQKASSYFQEALKSGTKRKNKKFASYALEILERYAAPLKEIEDLNDQLQTTLSSDTTALREKLKTAHFGIGRHLLAENGYIKIIKVHFDYITSHDPVNLEAHLYLADLNYSSMIYDEAIEHYKKILEIHPGNPFFQQRLGDIYIGVKNYDEAKKCYEEAVKLFDASGMSDKIEKIKYLKKLIGKLPTSLDEIAQLMDKSQYADIIALCKKRTAMNPSDVTAVTYMGIALEELGNWKQAKGLYETAIKRNPEYPTPHYYLGKLYLTRIKDTERALKEIGIFKEKSKELLEVDETAGEAIIAAQHTLVYIYHEILRDYKKAVWEGRKLVKLAPDDQGAHYNLALSYIYLDKKSMAHREFKKVIDINPDAKLGWHAKGMIENMQKYSSVKTMPYRRMEE
ncbi:MAG: tetratricopeptide repeat protein [Candidatus Omnitrophica bacterium]|nr:tetratricopeptide repeat protein [Candidatus Omnitrophota bacterium]